MEWLSNAGYVAGIVMLIWFVSRQCDEARAAKAEAASLKVQVKHLTDELQKMRDAEEERLDREWREKREEESDLALKELFAKIAPRIAQSEHTEKDL
ncbi:hypothetical protein ABFT38_002494 [Salmonella enterica]|nr:hypothetical protein [Salmonella enterica]EHJ9402013.1 hypothetical protein [Salmonella enterica]